jgi:hypothetical protein
MLKNSNVKKENWSLQEYSIFWNKKLIFFKNIHVYKLAKVLGV